MCIGAVSSFIRDSFFGITSERIGRSLRSKLFEALIKKDVSFFDDNRTGDICKIINFRNSFVSIKNSVRLLIGPGWSFLECLRIHKGILHDCGHDRNYVYL